MKNSNEAIILAIDPGLVTCGFSVLKKQGQNVYLLDYGVLRLGSSKPIPDRICSFYKFCEEKISLHSITCISLETPFLGKNPSSFMKLGYLRGVVYLISQLYHLVLFEFSPCEIKTALTGHGFASKEQVARFLMKIFPGIVMPTKLDATDALAVGLCCAMRS